MGTTYAVYRHVIYHWKAHELKFSMTLFYPAWYQPDSYDSQYLVVTLISRFTVHQNLDALLVKNTKIKIAPSIIRIVIIDTDRK